MVGVTNVVLVITQIVHVRSESSEYSSESDIFCISGGKVKAGDNAFYHDIIHIPPLPPSRLDGCNIIDVDYAIKVIIINNCARQHCAKSVIPKSIAQRRIQEFA